MSVKNRIFAYPPAFDALLRAVPVEYCHNICYRKKLELCGYVMVIGLLDVPDGHHVT